MTFRSSTPHYLRRPVQGEARRLVKHGKLLPMGAKAGRPLRGNLLSCFARSLAARLRPSGFDQAQGGGR